MIQRYSLRCTLALAGHNCTGVGQKRNGALHPMERTDAATPGQKVGSDELA